MAREPISQDRNDLESVLHRTRDVSQRVKDICHRARDNPDAGTGIVLSVRQGDVETRYRLEISRRRSVLVPHLVHPNGDSIRGLSTPDQLEEFFSSRASGRGALEYRFVLPGTQEEPAVVQEPREHVPEAIVPLPARADVMSFESLIATIYRRFGNAPLERRYLAIEVDGEIQGFITVEKRGRVFRLVDDFLDKRVTLIPRASREQKEAMAAFIEDDYGVEVQRCVFRIASLDEKAAYEEAESEESDAAEADVQQTDSAAPVAPAEQAPETPEDTGVATEDEAQRPTEDTGAATKSQHKKRRANRPKKKTRAQEKAKEARQREETYSSTIEQALSVAQDFIHDRPADGDISPFIARLSPLGLLRGENKNRLRRDLRSNPALLPLRAVLTLFRNEAMFKVKSLPLRLRGVTTQGVNLGGSTAAIATLVDLAKELFPVSSSDPLHAPETQQVTGQKDSRDLASYASTLFRANPLIFAAALNGLGKERWLDIGSGRTPSNPDSLIRLIKTFNPQIEMIGIDSSYDERTATVMDRESGRVGMDFDGASECSLLPGTAQNIPQADESIDRLLSAYVFDKFNDAEAIEGTQQALREAARVLVPGGEARICPIPLGEVTRSDSVVARYFDIVEGPDEMDYTDFGHTGRKYAFIVLRRKSLSKEQFAELKAESDAWKRRHNVV